MNTSPKISKSRVIEIVKEEIARKELLNEIGPLAVLGWSAAASGATYIGTKIFGQRG